jgi:hypothetical protein
MNNGDDNQNKTPKELFDEALAWLSGVETPLSGDAESPDRVDEPEVSHTSFRHDLIMEILKDKPGLTYEKLDQQMEQSGF